MVELLQILFGMALVAALIWGYLSVMGLLYERGWMIGPGRWGRHSGKTEIQTLFHGNTKDQDQI